MNNQLQTIRLYGPLGTRFGRTHRLAVGSVAEAVRALGVLFPGFNEFLATSKDRGLAYAIFYGKQNLAENQLHNPNGGEDIRIAPVIMGAKRGGIFQIILGAILIVAGVFLAGTPFGAPLIKLGIGLVIGGIVQLLTPVPKGKNGRERPENQPSYSFSGAVNTQAQGNSVSVLYGELIIGSAVISAGINAKDYAIVPEGSSSGGGSEGGGSGGGELPGGGGWSGGGMQEYYENWQSV